MNEVLNYFIKSLKRSTLSLAKKGILVGKPWALVDGDGEIEKLIFKKDNGLILSKNGKVTEGSWEYYPEAKALLIDRVSDKLLLKEQFIDDNALILKVDGTANDFFALANENIIPDYNIPKYLNTLKCEKFKITQQKLLNGQIMQVYGQNYSIYYIQDYIEKKVEFVDEAYNVLESKNGSYLTEDKKNTLHVKDGMVRSVEHNILRELIDGNKIEIEGGVSIYDLSYANRKVTMNGLPITDRRLIDKENLIYRVKESKITEILFVVEHSLKDGSKVKIEQKNLSKINMGDKIIESSPLFPLPDGAYRVKGKWNKIKVVNSTIC